MTTITIIKLVAILIGLLSVGGGILYLKKRLKKGDQALRENKARKKNSKLTSYTEKQKNEIRKQRNEKADNIINNPNGDNGVLQNVSRQHNHSFCDICTTNCPAYNK